MADRPIIFSAPMIRALLAGQKTQTRRVLKPQPFIDGNGNFCCDDRKGKVWNWGQHMDGRPCTRNFIAKRYAPGDRLWVKEAWARVGDIDDDIHACPDLSIHAYYRADAVDPERQRWRSPIHMPRWASRLTLTVTDVRVQRLQDISEADATAEGVDAVTMADVPRQAAMSRRSDFAGLWNSLHGPAAWDANPWVCAITFDVTRGNIDAPGVTHG